VTNAPVTALLGFRDRVGHVTRATGLVLDGARFGERDVTVECDAVLVAAGAIGSAALLLRTADESGAFGDLPAFHRERAGTALALAISAPLVALFPRDLVVKHGDRGLPFGIVAHLAEDGDPDALAIETVYRPPGVLGAWVPGLGESHRQWMANFDYLGAATVTIAGAGIGRVRADESVAYSVTDGDLGRLVDAVGRTAHAYLRAGAEAVGIGAGRVLHGAPRLVRGLEARGTYDGAIAAVRALVDVPADLALGSTAAFGSLRMHGDADLGAVDTDFVLHGSANVFVVDESVIPGALAVGATVTCAALGALGAGRAAHRLG
jgi:choline dehydrogenase-like flavoprotein